MTVLFFSFFFSHHSHQSRVFQKIKKSGSIESFVSRTSIIELLVELYPIDYDSSTFEIFLLRRLVEGVLALLYRYVHQVELV